MHKGTVRHGIVLALLIVLTGLPAQIACADQFHGINAGAVVWNNSLILTPQKAADIAATGTDSIRISFRLSGEAGITSWGATQLNLYDQVVQNARNAGLKILGIFTNETVSGGQAAWNNDPNQDGINNYVDDFADTALLLADRYKNDVQQWEVWNEPNSWTVCDPNQGGCNAQTAGGTYILPRVYATMQSEVYRHLNTGGQTLIDDYDMSLVSGGLFGHDIGGSFSSAMPYMQQVYGETGVWADLLADTGRLYPWDDFGYHFYLSQGSTIDPAHIANYINQVRGVKAANNDASDILLTEFSWRTDGSNTETLQRDNMAIAYDYLESQDDIRETYWYQWKDESPGVSWGIVEINGATQKLSYAEFVARNQAIEGDFNDDGVVDDLDLSTWGSGPYDGEDFLAWQRNLGLNFAPASAFSASVAVPEPSSAGLMGLMFIFGCMISARRTQGLSSNSVL